MLSDVSMYPSIHGLPCGNPCIPNLPIQDVTSDIWKRRRQVIGASLFHVEKE